MKTISRFDIASVCDEYSDVMEGGVSHDHKIIEDEHGTYRWEANQMVRRLVDSPSFDLNLYWTDKLQENPKAKNDPEVRKLYRDMGYSIFGYWEVFYWDVNNEYADEWDPNKE